MRHSVVMGGIGGQGVLLGGSLLAQAAVDAGLETSWYPSYSPEVRGGAVECTIVVADGRVGSPIVGRPMSAILLAPAAAAIHMPRVAEGGLVILNTGIAEAPVERADLRVIRLDANALATEAGSEQAVNMVMLGAYLSACLPDLIEPAAAAIARVLPQRHHQYIPMNQDAIHRGVEAAQAS